MRIARPNPAFLLCGSVLLFSLQLNTRLYAQAGLLESLQRLDTNNNGEIDPDEVTPLARPYLERITSVRSRSSLSLDRSIEIERLQEAARIYYSTNNGSSGRDVEPEGESTVKPFGPDPRQPMVPDFGLPEIKYPYSQEDLERADERLRRYDRDDDGFLDRREASRARWTSRDPFENDLDKDDRLSRMELGQRYARRRLLSDTADELIRKARRVGTEVEPSKTEPRRRSDSEWWRDRSNSRWLTSSVMSRFDANRNGRLEPDETQKLGIPAGQIDTNLDGELSRSELHAVLDGMQESVTDASTALPGWFYERDENGDGQVAMSEFASDWTTDKMQEFEMLDSNEDGLLTSLEVSASRAMVGGSYRNTNSEILPPRKTIISEINIDEDFVIGDLNLQLSITHSNVGHLDAYLTGPDGQRIELFTEVGGSGDHFDQTTFDDQSRDPITKARAPFDGRYLTEALLKRQPSLGHYVGKNARGSWQLMIRGARSDRFGMLHSWGLITRPQEGIDGPPSFAKQTAPAADGAIPGPPNMNKSDRRIQSQDQGRSPLAGQPIDTERSIAKDKTAKWELKQADSEARANAIAKYKEWLDKKKRADLSKTKSSGDKSRTKKFDGDEAARRDAIREKILRKMMLERDK